MPAGSGGVAAGVRGVSSEPPRRPRAARAGSGAGRCRESRPGPGRPLGTAPHHSLPCFASLRFAGRRRRGAGGEECRGRQRRRGSARLRTAKKDRRRKWKCASPRRAAAARHRHRGGPSAWPRPPEVSAALGREGGGRRGPAGAYRSTEMMPCRSSVPGAG